MTPEEKAKHLAALEEMLEYACSHVAEFNGDVDEESAEWRAAIDAFEALCEPSVITCDLSRLPQEQRDALLAAAHAMHCGPIVKAHADFRLRSGFCCGVCGGISAHTVFKAGYSRDVCNQCGAGE